MSRFESDFAVAGEISVNIPDSRVLPDGDRPWEADSRWDDDARWADEDRWDEYEQEVPKKPKKKARKKKMHNKELGRRGEDAAARFLTRRGYVVLERNWTCDAGEADIIAQDGDCLVFVEVKTRMDEDRGLPEEAVGSQKRQRYERIAASYLRNNDIGEMQLRFDVIGILVLGEDRAMIRHHINAFGVC